MVKEFFFNVFSTVDLQSGHGFQLFSSNYYTVMFWTSIWSDACSPCFSSLVISWSGCHLSIYICTTLNRSLFWGCVHWNSALRTSFGMVFCRAAVTSLKRHFLGLFCTWLLLDFFDGPNSCTGREAGGWCLSLSPPDNLWSSMVPLSPSCSSYTAYFSFNLDWGDQTCSVIACRNCCTHAVVLGALFWSFSISIVPLFFEMQGHNCTQYLTCRWNMNFQCDTMTSLFRVPFLITLNTQTPCFDCSRTLSWYFHGPVYHTMKNS